MNAVPSSRWSATCSAGSPVRAAPSQSPTSPLATYWSRTRAPASRPRVANEEIVTQSATCQGEPSAPGGGEGESLSGRRRLLAGFPQAKGAPVLGEAEG